LLWKSQYGSHERHYSKHLFMSNGDDKFGLDS
jgi:hypothetical protein